MKSMNQDEIMRAAQMYGRTQFHNHLKFSLELYARASEAAKELDNSGAAMTLSEYLANNWIDDYPVIYNVTHYYQRLMSIPRLNINRFAHQMTLIARKERESLKKRKNK